MTRWTLIPLAATLIGLSACGGATAANPTPSPPQVLLNPSQLPGGPWETASTGTARWPDLEQHLVPCGRRVIAPADAEVHYRVFRSDDTKVVELAVSGLDPTQAFKRFYAECGAVGDVDSEPGPHHVATHDGKTEIATFTDTHLIVISGTAPAETLNKIAATARTQAS
ncbi:hypothetical protein ABGB17_03490 [Sphaerisporangium sp. B11E5]|uniref:hypothetical protein n=1 Tax=Sphaerisporangium sp. B11E5 TaxID=3153563 RepID=UPI00325EA81A